MKTETRQSVSKVLTLAEVYRTIRDVLHISERDDVLDDIRINKRITKYNLLQLCSEDPNTGINYRLYIEIVKDAHNKVFPEKVETNFRVVRVSRQEANWMIP